jgi:hypothetical protein
MGIITIGMLFNCHGDALLLFSALAPLLTDDLTLPAGWYVQDGGDGIQFKITELK